MAMTLRLPEDLDAAAKTLAEREHRSLHGFVVNAVEEYIRRHGMDVVVDQVAAEGARKYADALGRLGRA
ncbi:MAG: Arc family DNA-binding protein [Actinocatenispora sp.]